jgi:hypothetical protein
MICGLFFIAAENASAQNCQPDANQIAVVAEKNFRGQCKVLDVGDYPDAAAMGFDDDAVSSVKIGMYVYAILYATDFEGELNEEVKFDIADLAKSRVGDNTVSAILILEIEKLQKNMIGTWAQNDQTVIIDKNKLTVYRNGKVFFTGPYKVIVFATDNLEEGIEFTGTKGTVSQRKVSFKDNNKIMVWTNISDNTSSEFTRVLKSAKPAAKSKKR